MPYKIITSLFLVCAFGALWAQQVSADSLLAYELAYYKSDNDTLKQEILLKKINYYLKNNVTSADVFKEQKRLSYHKIKLGLNKQNFLWNATLVAYINEQTEDARFYMLEYAKTAEDTSVLFHLLRVLVNKYSDTLAVNQSIKILSKKDVVFNSLNCFSKLALYNRRHEKFYLISSLIVPGSGTAMNGEVLKGMVSLLLSAGSVYGVYKLVQYGLYVNAFLWGTGVGLKFYTGNIKLTQKTFHEKEIRQKNKLANNCELKLKEILIQYPLTLRGL